MKRKRSVAMHSEPIAIDWKFREFFFISFKRNKRVFFSLIKTFDVPSPDFSICRSSKESGRSTKAENNNTENSNTEKR